MKIVSARATGNFLSIPATTTITAGSINTHAVQFTLSSEWDNLTPTAVFSAGGTEITVAMTDRAAPVVVPWEVTATAGRGISVGLFGVASDGTVVLPTRWARLCIAVAPAPSTDGTPAVDPTPTVYEQWLADIAADAASAAASAQITANPAYIGDNGNWYTYSADDNAYVDSGVQAQGDKGDTGLQGEQGETGATGATGADGYTPVRGTDYFTQSDIDAMVATVREQAIGDIDSVLDALNGEVIE